MWKKYIFLALGVALISYVYRAQQSPKLLKSPIVDTAFGKVQGTIDYSRNGIEIHQYLGIPFARPPLGELRFELPQPPEPWEGVRESSKISNLCIQIDIVSQQLFGVEDCLNLNVYVPKQKIPSASKKPLEVLFWIHGGIYMYGGTHIFGPKYFADENVILVTTAYRLGSFGFLNTGRIRGNAGLKDQVQALKWVQQNIAAFGGDPHRVTIFGESAGASSVHLHQLSPMSKGLFYKAISQSGTAISPFVLTRYPEKQAQRLGKQLNCPTENSEELVNCLKQADAGAIVEVHRETTDLLHESISIFSVTIETIKDENAFLTEDPMTLLRNGKIVNKVPWISGVNSDEGLILSAAIVQNQTILEALDKSWNQEAPKFLFYEKNDTVSNHVRKQYFGNAKKIGFSKNLHKFTLMLSDRSFYWPISESASLQSKIAPVYLYYYSHVSEFSFAHFMTLFRRRFHYIVEILMDVVASFINRHVLGQRHHTYGTCHADELFLQFNTPFSPYITSVDGEHFKMSRDIIKLWADFAKDEPNLQFRGVKWLPIDPRKTSSPLQYLMIDMSYGIINEPFGTRIKYWRENFIF